MRYFKNERLGKSCQLENERTKPSCDGNPLLLSDGAVTKENDKDRCLETKKKPKENPKPCVLLLVVTLMSQNFNIKICLNQTTTKNKIRMAVEKNIVAPHESIAQ
jgi:hypothetical protein